MENQTQTLQPVTQPPKEGAIAALQVLFSAGVVLVSTGILYSLGLEVMGDVRDDQTASSLEFNATTKAMDGVKKVPDKLPLIGTVLVASLVIGLITTFLVFRGSK